MTIGVDIEDLFCPWILIDDLRVLSEYFDRQFDQDTLVLF
jgi:hypothetical protein